MSPTAGYSLYELLVTLAIAATLLLLGAPPFGELIARNRLVVEINALHHAIHQGRQEAIKRGVNLVLCQSGDGRACDGGRDWAAGWMLFVDADDDGRRDPAAGDTLVRHHRPAGGLAILSNRRLYTLRGVRRRNTNGTFLVCDTSRRTDPRALIVSFTGRPRSAPGARAPAALICP